MGVYANGQSTLLMFNQKNSKKQGDVGLGEAIRWFSRNDYTVCLPLTDSQPYDLVVDNGSGLKRVQVKTTSEIRKTGNYSVSLRVNGGNRSWNTIPKKLDPASVDLIFILTSNETVYLIPVEKLRGLSKIELGNYYNQFIV